MTRRQQQNWFGVATIILVVIMVLAAWIDLPLSQMVINYHSYWATVGQTIGEFPLYFVFVISGEIAMASALRQQNQLAGGAEFLGGLALSSWQLKQFLNEVVSYGTTAFTNLHHGMAVGTPSQLNDQSSASATGWSQVIIWLVLYLLISIVMQWWLQKQSTSRLRQLLLIAVFASLTALLALDANGALKTIWGRFRPYEVQKHVQNFTTWYHINGVNGHKSFPSGHTMAATLAIVFSWFVRGKWHRWMWTIGVGYGILIGLSRLVIGAHFLSDITFSFFLTAAIIYVMHYLLESYLNSDH